MKKLRVAIVGQGRSGRDIHGAFFRSENNDKFEVVAVVDALEERRERARAEYGCDVYASHEQLYDRKDIDLVVNSTFSHLHYPVTMDLLTHGFNVVVEKPFSAHREECEAMIRAAREHSVLLSVFQQSHFAPYYRRLRELLDSGVLGRPVQIGIRFNGFARRWDWQCAQRFYGGSLRNTGPHPLEQALDLLDMDCLPQVVSRLDRANSFGDAEDYVKLILTMPGRPLIDLEISSCDAYPWGTYKLEGTCGSLCGTQSKLAWKWFVPSEAPEQHLIRTPLTTPEGEPAYCGEKLVWHEDSWEAGVGQDAFTSAVHVYYTTIYDHLTEGKPLTVTVKQVRRQIAVIEEAHRQNPMPRLDG